VTWEAPSLDRLPKGHRFDPVPFRLEDEWVDAYLAAVEDQTTPKLGEGVVPPLATIAMAVRALLHQARLPAGAVHLGQELRCRRPLCRGEELVAEMAISSHTVRQGWHFIQVAMVIKDRQGEEVLTGEAIIISPQREEA
jgi:acyl dehydratase